ncbi:isocitrate lyase/phosphoenolpyruvate mutase family protein [Lentzea sp. NPDC102401]|uniref:isocitrate lyase/phosphoenolpyruvate mutase family protein n=1 Tax=Lentzea sp. NPDC102401 TaxID=3364128 RepID=UPI0038147DB7
MRSPVAAPTSTRGASNFFVPGKLDTTQVERLVEALGERKVNLIGIPGSIPLDTAQKLGISRVSYGPWSQNVALTALAKLAEDVYAGGGLPDDTRKLNRRTRYSDRSPSYARLGERPQCRAPAAAGVSELLITAADRDHVNLPTRTVLSGR